MANPVRIAMWSGPRNISTALMRSWGNRPDTMVIDEPFYALYLQRTGKHHPGWTEIVSQTQTDVDKIIESLLASLPADKTVFYKKQMAHHLWPGIDRTWLNAVTNCFLIRDPADVITSYLRKNPEPTIEDLGFIQQAELFDLVRCTIGAVPPIIDASDVLQNPRRTLHLLCRAVGVEFDTAMLSWPPGLRETDGIWAKYWYAEVAKSTCFQPYRSKAEAIPVRLQKIYEQCRDAYEELYKYRLH